MVGMEMWRIVTLLLRWRLLDLLISNSPINSLGLILDLVQKLM